MLKVLVNDSDVRNELVFVTPNNANIPLDRVEQTASRKEIYGENGVSFLMFITTGNKNLVSALTLRIQHLRLGCRVISIYSPKH